MVARKMPTRAQRGKLGGTLCRGADYSLCKVARFICSKGVVLPTENKRAAVDDHDRWARRVASRRLLEANPLLLRVEVQVQHLLERMTSLQRSAEIPTPAQPTPFISTLLS
jgi:hypothetical protein